MRTPPVIIAGPPRVGKSQLAAAVAAELGYGHICTDSLIQAWGHARVQPRVTWDDLPDTFGRFLFMLVLKQSHFGGFVYEGQAFRPRWIADIQAELPCAAHFLGCCELGLEAYSELVRRHARSQRCWTSDMDDAALRAMLTSNVQQSKAARAAEGPWRYMDLAAGLDAAARTVIADQRQFPPRP